METKKILGLDLGTNSIGWALIEKDDEKKTGRIVGAGSRIIPMSQKTLTNFGEGSSISQTAERTRLRSVRKLIQRFQLRRERLHRVLNLMNWLPEHYRNEIDFIKHKGKYLEGKQPKITYKPTVDLANNSTSYEFIFKYSFLEMVEDFRLHQPHFLTSISGNQLLIPHDWTIYYLRKKALNQKISAEELAWILLNFNQKRGYSQLRGEEEEEVIGKIVEYHSLFVTDVIQRENGRATGEYWYDIFLENGWIYPRPSKIPLYDLKDKKLELIVTTELNEDGSVKIKKDGGEKRSFRAPDVNDWTLIKKRTEDEISSSGKTVGEFIYDSLIAKPNLKIRGKLIQTIERKFYKEELLRILEKQSEFHPILTDKSILQELVRELYPFNLGHASQLMQKNLIHLLVNDIIYYQRPLKSQKSSISDCSLEFRFFRNKEGQVEKQALKAIAKSHPLFQEFRIWQWLHNLSIYRKSDDINVTKEFIDNIADKEQLFDFLYNRKEIEQKALIKFLLEAKGIKGKELKQRQSELRWNYVEDKTYPCNETFALIDSRLQKIDNLPSEFLTLEIQFKLWHILYSVSDPKEYEKALKSFACKFQIDETQFYETFKRVPPLSGEYGAYSEKAIRKLLALMRVGKYWNSDEFDDITKRRIENLLSGEYDETIRNRVREKAIHLNDLSSFQGLQLWLAQYVIYDRHSETADLTKWNSPGDLEIFIKNFRQHSLRNPIVEQVVLETLRVVKDLWVHYGNGQQSFFNEIHVELGREMKNPADKRKELTRKNNENENTNFRIKALLHELVNDPNVINVRPFSPVQQEILKIYEDGVLAANPEPEEDIRKISKSSNPTAAELKRYKLWLEQKYRSPYTGAIIPLNRLFTPEYEIEHIIPQSRFFDDSLSNKVICEAAVNKLKDNQMGLEFILNHHGEKVELGMGRSVNIFGVEAYKEFIGNQYEGNRSKKNRLLLEDIPEKMIERQLNDTRFIGKYVSNLLSNLVRESVNDDNVNSKNLVVLNGKITATLRKDWGLDNIWNDIILPRFERMQKLRTEKQIQDGYNFLALNSSGKVIPVLEPISIQKGFSKKRIDHRHHALDAIVIACTTRNHVNLLNNINAESAKRHDLNRKLRRLEKVRYKNYHGELIEREVPKEFLQPWENFPVEAKSVLNTIIVSFKQNLRILNRSQNRYFKWQKEDSGYTKIQVSQIGYNWVVRKPLHKATFYGKVDLRQIKVPKDKIITAVREKIGTNFNQKFIEESITDKGIQKILLNYLREKGGDAELAFTPEGLENMNLNIIKYNDGKSHKPIYAARKYEIGSKFQLGSSANTSVKYVEAEKGTNLFYAIYISKQGKRSFDTVPLNIVIERLKEKLSPVPELNLDGNYLSFYLSPNDLVYMPTQEEIANGIQLKQLDISNLNRARLFNVNDFSNTCYFTPNSFARSIVNKEVDLNLKNMTITGSYDLKTASCEGVQIKDHCLKLKVNRIGIISK